MVPSYAALVPHEHRSEANKLTDQQQAFVEAYVANGGNATKAALAAGYAKASASVTASRTLRLPHVQQELQKQMVAAIGLAAVPAIQRVKGLMRTAKSDYVKLEAARDLLDRAGFKPPDRVAVALDAGLSVSFDIAPKGGGVQNTQDE